MLTSVIQSLFPESEISDWKPKCAIHALSLLASLQNRHCRNDVTLIFTILLVSYGAGCRMINMLNKCGLTIHWNTLMNHLDQQLEDKVKHSGVASPTI